MAMRDYWGKEHRYREQTNLPPLNMATTPYQRWVHVHHDGAETDYMTAPADVPTIKVTLGKPRKAGRTILEETITPWERPPPGKGWELVGGKAGEWRWQRRRKQVWA